MTFVGRWHIIISFILPLSQAGFDFFESSLFLTSFLVSEIHLSCASSVIPLNVLSDVCNYFVLLLLLFFFYIIILAYEPFRAQEIEGFFAFENTASMLNLSTLQCSLAVTFEMGPVYYSVPSQAL